MNIKKAIKLESPGVSDIGALKVKIDKYWFIPGRKYTILELGWAVYLGNLTTQKEGLDQWIRIYGEIRPRDKEWNELRSGNSMLVTSHPVLVALAINEWWHEEGKDEVNLPGKEVSVPSFEEAVRMVRDRKIINDCNKKYAGIVPGLERWSS